MLTRTSEYALRALIHLTRNEREWPIPGNVIAHKTGIPAKYLSTVLRELVRAGVLGSARGKSGGFRLACAAQDTSLFTVLEPFEPVLSPKRPCPFGNVTCNDDDPCLGHEGWTRVREGYYAFLRDTTVYDVAIGREGLRRTVELV